MTSSVKKALIVVALIVAVAVVILAKNLVNRPNPGLSHTNSTQSAIVIPRLVELGGDCTVCKMMQPILEELRIEYAGSLHVDSLNTVTNPDLAAQYNVQIFPTQIFYDASGKELFRHEGFIPKEDILARFKKLGVKLEKPK